MANDDYNSGGYGKGYDGSSYGTPAAPVNFGAEESRYGDNTRGSYFVQLPDGRIEKVNYYVNGYSGYVADVTYEPAPNAYQTPSSSYGGMPPTSTGAHRRPAPVY